MVLVVVLVLVLSSEPARGGVRKVGISDEWGSRRVRSRVGQGILGSVCVREREYATNSQNVRPTANWVEREGGREGGRKGGRERKGEEGKGEEGREGDRQRRGEGGGGGSNGSNAHGLS